MKKLMITAAALMLLTYGASAQTEKTVKDNKATEEVQQQEERTKIERDQIPNAVKETLNQVEYKDFEIDSAYKIKKGDRTYYEVVVTNGEKRSTFKFDEEGKKVE